MRTPTRQSLAAVLGALALEAGCSREVASLASPAALRDWSQPSIRPVATAVSSSGERLRLELRHEPAGESVARMRLVLVGPRGEEQLWAVELELAARERLWGASWGLAFEPAPGGRLAVSTDAGARWRPAFAAAGGWLFCPHVQVAGERGAPDWQKLPGTTRWAAQVLQTAVWGCDGAGRCHSRALAGGPVHFSYGAEELLPKDRVAELRGALALAERLEPDRALALALFDAAVGYQHGLGQQELERLGVLAARGLGARGPLGLEERRALRLRLTLAREELKRAAPVQLSPRVSIQALARGLEAAR